MATPQATAFTARVTAPGFWFTLTFMSETPPDALLFITPGCPHCAGVLEGLGEPVKQMLIGKMTVVNVAAHPELAAEYGVRSDACHLLGLASSAAARAPVEICLDDAHPEVREIAGEALAAQDAKR